MRAGRRFVLEFLLLATFALLSLSNVSQVLADAAVEESTGGTGAGADAHAEVDAADNVVETTDEPEPSKEEDVSPDSEAEPSDEADATQAAAEAAPTEATDTNAAAEASSDVNDAEETQVDSSASNNSPSTLFKALPFADKMTPMRMKKVAAGALGIWGAAAGAGWLMNNLGGAQELQE